MGGDPYEVAPRRHLVPTSWWAGGLAASTVLAVAIISPLLAMPAWQTLAAVLMSCLIAVLAVRAPSRVIKRVTGRMTRSLEQPLMSGAIA